MDCPICNVPLKELDYEGITVNHCEKCDGYWLDEGALKKINAIHKKTFSPEQIAEAHEMVKKKAIATKSDEARHIGCPHCGKECKTSSVCGVNIDECPDKKGVWLDKGEIEKLQILAEDRGHIFTPDLRGKLPEQEDSPKVRGAFFLSDQFAAMLDRLWNL